MPELTLGLAGETSFPQDCGSVLSTNVNMNITLPHVKVAILCNVSNMYLNIGI